MLNEDTSGHWAITWKATQEALAVQWEAELGHVRTAEDKYYKADEDYQAWRKRAYRRLKAANRKMARLNPMGDLDQMSTADKRTLADTEAKRDDIVMEMRKVDIPIRMHFVTAELPPRTLATGQHEHSNSVKQALQDDLPVPGVVIDEFVADWLKPRQGRILTMAEAIAESSRAIGSGQ